MLLKWPTVSDAYTIDTQIIPLNDLAMIKSISVAILIPKLTFPQALENGIPWGASWRQRLRLEKQSSWKSGASLCHGHKALLPLLCSKQEWGEIPIVEDRVRHFLDPGWPLASSWQSADMICRDVSKITSSLPHQRHPQLWHYWNYFHSKVDKGKNSGRNQVIISSSATRSKYIHSYIPLSSHELHQHKATDYASV